MPKLKEILTHEQRSFLMRLKVRAVPSRPCESCREGGYDETCTACVMKAQFEQEKRN